MESLKLSLEESRVAGVIMWAMAVAGIEATY